MFFQKPSIFTTDFKAVSSLLPSFKRQRNKFKGEGKREGDLESRLFCSVHKVPALSHSRMREVQNAAFRAFSTLGKVGVTHLHSPNVVLQPQGWLTRASMRHFTEQINS